MPELPEVETIRRQLAPALQGRVLRRLLIGDPRWCSPLAPAELSAALEGRRLERLERRGKYFVAAFAGETFLIMHLRMTGTLLLGAADGTPYERVRMSFDSGPDLRFCDPRRFGTGGLALGEAARDAFLDARLGVEPLSEAFTGKLMHALVRDRRAPIKAVLLDQRSIAGVGNIYADEALHRAGIHPMRPACRLSRDQSVALRDAVVTALRAGIAAGGATIDDFRHSDGVRGAFQDEFLVHRRRGEPCPGCGREIVKFVCAGRGTYACEGCQPRPRAARRSREVLDRARARA